MTLQESHHLSDSSRSRLSASAPCCPTQDEEPSSPDCAKPTGVPAIEVDKRKQRSANVRTAIALLSIALTFFFGVILAREMGGYQVGMSVVGFAIFVFLVFAIGRNLRSRK